MTIDTVETATLRVLHVKRKREFVVSLRGYLTFFLLNAYRIMQKLKRNSGSLSRKSMGSGKQTVLLAVTPASR